MLSILGKIFSRRHFEIFFFNFSQKTGYDISCKLSPEETICMKCQSLFSGKNKKNIINLSSAENAQRVVKVNNARIFFFFFFKLQGIGFCTDLSHCYSYEYVNPFNFSVQKRKSSVNCVDPDEMAHMNHLIRIFFFLFCHCSIFAINFLFDFSLCESSY